MKKFKEYWISVLAALKTITDFQRFLLFAVTAKSLLKAIHPFVMILVTSQVITMLTDGETAAKMIAFTGIGVIAAFLICVAGSILDQYCTVRFEDCWRRYEGLTGEKTLSIDYPQLENPKTAALRQKMREDENWGAGLGSIYWAFSSLTEAFFTLITAVLITLPLLLFTKLNHIIIAGVFGTAIIILICISVYINRRAAKKEQTAMNHIAKENNLYAYFLQGLEYAVGKDVRIYKAQQLIEETGKTYGLAAADRFYSKNIKTVGTASGIGAAISMLIQGSTYLFVSLCALSGFISIGMVVRYAGSIYQFTAALTRIFDGISSLTISAERQRSTQDYFNIPDVLSKGTLTTEKRSDNHYELEFHNVSFRYPGSDSYSLKNLNLRLNVGRRMAVVGMNGSGKTTMIKLLCRLYDPTDGEITLNGIDIRKYEYEEYLQIFSVVFQDFKLFSLPLGQNVAAGVHYDSAKAERCLEMAGLKDRLTDMPKGLETSLYKDFDKDGVEISGGEAQKTALARALYKDAPFIILDEPTAALDPIAEFEIYSKFNEIVADKTAVYISHRLSSCRFCDDIAVFHEGELIQQGNHETLLADRNGKYYELWNAQAKYYNEGAAV